MHRSILTPLLVLAATSSLLSSALAQEPADNQARRTNGLNVYLDCQRMRCDRNHIRLEIPYVNWVRDRADADVHILGTSQGTGGGREVIFNFIGLRDHAGHVDTLRYTTSRTDVTDEERDLQVLTLQMGLMRFVANTPVTDFLTISYDAPGGEEVRALPEDDPWNYWIFSVGANGNVDSESLERSYRISANVSANKTTEDWRISFYARGVYDEDRFEYEDIPDSVAVYNNSTYSARTYVIRRLSEHWGAGMRASIGNSISYNHDLYVRGAAGLEYSVFPYAESTRRSLTILYGLGVSGFDYEEMTIFEKTSEVLLQQGLEVALGYVQPWGNIGADLEALSYLHDLALHRIEVGIGVSVRVMRGLRFNMGSSAARIRDQIYLSGEGIPQDEILLRRRARGTDFELGVGFGFSYTFGSIFNNAVNPAMENFR